MRIVVSRGMIIFIAVAVVLAGAITWGVLALLDAIDRARRAAIPAGCEIRTPRGERDLEVEQARVAAVIAAVAERRRMPRRALVIAYATGLQESKLFNLDHGDRDSVGVFQQRPSMGWGSEKQLRDPVYATRKFFDALARVPGYRKMPIDRAAQAVQRSADGRAYARHEEEARLLADAFTGRVPKAVRCWPSGKSLLEERPAKKGPADARRALSRALGKVPGTAESLRAGGARRGWTAANWAVAHAEKYGIAEVSYEGSRWSAREGTDGWKPAPRDQGNSRDQGVIRITYGSRAGRETP